MRSIIKFASLAVIAFALAGCGGGCGYSNRCCNPCPCPQKCCPSPNIWDGSSGSYDQPVSGY